MKNKQTDQASRSSGRGWRLGHRVRVQSGRCSQPKGCLHFIDMIVGNFSLLFLLLTFIMARLLKCVLQKIEVFILAIAFRMLIFVTIEHHVASHHGYLWTIS
jgi:hypothetical protein